MCTHRGEAVAGREGRCASERFGTQKSSCKLTEAATQLITFPTGSSERFLGDAQSVAVVATISHEHIHNPGVLSP